MIHSVYFWLDESLDAAQKSAFEAGMKALAAIDVVASGEIGQPAGTPVRPVTNNTFDYALFLKFASVEDHNAYQVHPDHQVFVDSFSPWFKTVQIFDTDYLP